MFIWFLSLSSTNTSPTSIPFSLHLTATVSPLTVATTSSSSPPFRHHLANTATASTETVDTCRRSARQKPQDCRAKKQD